MSTRRQGGRVVVTAALCTSAALLAACGSGSTSKGGGSGGVGPASPPNSTLGAPVVFGALAGFTGAESTFGQAFNEGCQVAIKEINDSGGIRGQKIQISTRDR